MAQVINTNSLSLLTQNNLNKSQSSLNTAIQRLSSGLRINSAKDDAAGQAIANRFTANIRGLTQASRNANDGISLAQTTEGALSEVNTNLQRIRELAVQSATGSNSAADKASIQAEITQRLEEIDRTSAQTDFNGVKVLSSAAGKLNVQIGANDGESISIDLEEISAKTLGLTGFNVGGSADNKVASSTDLLAAGYAKNAAAPVNGTQIYDKSYVAADFANLSDVVGKAVKNDTVLDASKAITYTADGAGSFGFTDATRTAVNVASDLKPAAGGSTAVNINIRGTSVDAKIDSNGMLTSAASGNNLYLDAATGNLTENSGGTLQQANINGGAAGTGNLLLSLGGAAGIGSGTITVGSAATAPTYTYTAGTLTANATNLSITSAALTTQVQASNTTGTSAITTTLGGTAYVAAAGTAGNPGLIKVGAAQASIDMNGALTVNTKETLYAHDNGSVTDASANVVYNDSANAGKFTFKAQSGVAVTADPLKALDAALSKVDKLRGALGAVQNRFDSVISNLGTTITNLSSSRSRIEDADYATEVSNMTRANILQQAGTSVLAQANQTTQGVLSLLR